MIAGLRAVFDAAPLLFLGVFCAAPTLLVLRIALSEQAMALPPYRPLFEGLEMLGVFLSALGTHNFATLWSDDLYLSAYLTSLRLAATATLLCLAIGYPMAHAIAHAPRRAQGVLLTLVILPFWTSFLIRVYAWIGILKPEGLLSAALQALGLADQPVGLLNSEAAILVGLVHSYLPFMVLPLYACLEKLDPAYLEAASDLGAKPSTAFWTVTLPLSLPGIWAGAALVFIPATGEFVIPDLLGGPDTLMIGHVLWTEFFSNRDWPLASAAAIVLLVLLIAPILAVQAAGRRRARQAGGA